MPSDNYDLAHTDHTPKPWSTARVYAREPITWVLVTGALIGLGVVIAVAYAVLWLLVTIVTGIFNFIVWIGRELTDLAEPSARTITDPVRHYIEAHAAHLPVSAQTIWWTWVTITIGLFALATLGSRGARIGWAVIGATTTAVAWAAAAPGNQLVNAAIAASAWAALSVVAFNGITQQPEPRVVELHLDSPRSTDSSLHQF